VVELSKHIQTTDQSDVAASKKKGKHNDLALFFPKVSVSPVAAVPR